YFFFQAEDGIRSLIVTGVQTCALPICHGVRVGLIVDRSILRASTFVLTVQADMPTEQLHRLFPSQVKIGAVEHIRDLVNVLLPRSEERRVGKECRSRCPRYTCDEEGIV